MSLARVLSKRFVVIDGSLSAELDCLNYVFRDSPFWTGKAVVFDPSYMKQVHINSIFLNLNSIFIYLKNGADIIATGSYQLNIDYLMKNLNITADDARSIIKRSVEIAKQARKESGCEDALVAGSIGSLGACLGGGQEYSGTYVNDMTIEELIEWHKPRFDALLEAGADLLAFETIPSIKESIAMCNLLKQYPNTKAWLSFSCRNDSQISIGETFCEAYETFAQNEQLIAIGVNCIQPIHIENLLKSVKECKKPFIVYPNDGSIWDSVQETYVKDESINTVKLFSDLIPKWKACGAKYIGACCRVTSKELAEFTPIISS